MGLSVLRKGDVCTGHSGFPPRPNISGSSDVTVNGLPVHRTGDAWDKHCKRKNGCHPSVSGSGSATVKVNGLPVIRTGDPVACGSKAGSGSSDVACG